MSMLEPEGHEAADPTSAQPIPVVQYSTFRVSDYLGWQEDGSLELRPHFQRGAVWDANDRSLLIDSLMRGFPIPLVVLQEEWDVSTNKMRKRVIDGQQRLRTLLSFTRPELLTDRIASDDFLYRPPGRRSGLTYSELSIDAQRRIVSSALPAVMVASDASDPFVLEIYERLNTTGKRLTGQELRYARREGAFAELAYQLARANQGRWTEWKLLSTKDVGRMLDVQFTSELMLLMLDGIQKTGKREIDAAYSGSARTHTSGAAEGRVTGRGITREDHSYIETIFQRIMDALDSAYAFPPDRGDAMRFLRSRAWFYSLFGYALYRAGFLDESGKPLIGADVGSGVRALERLDSRSITSQLVEQYASSVSSDTELAKAVSGAASDRRARLSRFLFIKSAAGGSA